MLLGTYLFCLHTGGRCCQSPICAQATFGQWEMSPSLGSHCAMGRASWPCWLVVAPSAWAATNVSVLCSLSLNAMQEDNNSRKHIQKSWEEWMIARRFLCYFIFLLLLLYFFFFCMRRSQMSFPRSNQNPLSGGEESEGVIPGKWS